MSDISNAQAVGRYTRGPWKCHIERTDTDGVNVRFSINSEAKVMIASGQSQEHLGDGILEAECVANAYLMTAAPGLLIALEECAVHMGAVFGDSDPYVKRAFAAIHCAVKAEAEIEAAP